MIDITSWKTLVFGAIALGITTGVSWFTVKGLEGAWPHVKRKWRAALALLMFFMPVLMAIIQCVVIYRTRGDLPLLVLPDLAMVYMLVLIGMFQTTSALVAYIHVKAREADGRINAIARELEDLKASGHAPSTSAQ